MITALLTVNGIDLESLRESLDAGRLGVRDTLRERVVRTVMSGMGAGGSDCVVC
jgi:hypothetical protein